MPLSAIAAGLSGITLLKDPIGNNIRQYLFAQSISLGSEYTAGDPADDLHIITTVRALLLNGLQVFEFNRANII
jgi:hypothetical protein